MIQFHHRKELFGQDVIHRHLTLKDLFRRRYRRLGMLLYVRRVRQADLVDRVEDRGVN